MTDERMYDCAIVGGGLGGLTLAINLQKSGVCVVLLEKEIYPFHKVCGEYISMESWDYLESLGLPLSSMKLPRINELLVTAPNGAGLSAGLGLGGFGISRFTLDAELYVLAKQAGVLVVESCKVEDIRFDDDVFEIHSSHGQYRAKVCCGCFGKRSNIDVKMKRSFIAGDRARLNNYIAVKYHVLYDGTPEHIALHNFPDGYCGFSQVEASKYCLCYLTTAANLKQSDNSISKMEETILCSNPALKKLFGSVRMLYDTPLVISQISFEKKAPVEDHILMVGDSAGLITPLCGNGMSMAMHAGKIAAQYIKDFLEKRRTRAEMEINYSTSWNRTFDSRLKVGRFIQGLFGKKMLTNLFIRTMKASPKLTQMLIRRTHGQRY